MSLRFHWMLPKAGEADARSAREAALYRIESTGRSSPASAVDLPGWCRFAHRAEESGIDSTLISFSRYEPDPLVIASALGPRTGRLRFILAFRAGLMQPAMFVQQVNTLSQLIGGRVSLNLVAGSSREEQRGYGDFLAHDDRYERAGEFLEICRSFWGSGDGPAVHFEGKHYHLEGGDIRSRFVDPDRAAPEVYVSGHSEAARRLAATPGSCWLRVVDTPARLRAEVAAAREGGNEVCLRLCIACRPTRAEAVEFVETLLPGDDGARARTVAAKDDSQMYRAASEDGGAAWPSPRIWAGFASRYGPVWTALVGTPEELAAAFLDYGRLGVTQFILSGWPELDEMAIFGREVLPLIRAAERREADRGAKAARTPARDETPRGATP